MAKTYWAEGRQIAKIVKAFLGIFSLTIYFYIIPGMHWGVLVGLIVFSLLIGEIVGANWTKKKRLEKKGGFKSGTIVKKQANDSSQSKKLSDKELLTAKIESLSGIDFERIVEMYYRDKGYPVQRIGGSGDHGVDIIIQEKDGARVAIQCKRQKQDVGNAVVLKLDSGKRAHKCHVGRIVTTAYFTREAKDAAERLKIELVNGMATLDMLENWRKKKLKYSKS